MHVSKQATHIIYHTGSCPFAPAPVPSPPPLLLPPAVPTHTNALCTGGPTTGTPPTNAASVVKKSPNSTNRPYSSIAKPINVQRNRMRTMPSTNVIVPVIFCGRAKKERVLDGPRMSGRPIRKRTYSYLE